MTPPHQPHPTNPDTTLPTMTPPYQTPTLPYQPRHHPTNVHLICTLLRAHHPPPRPPPYHTSTTPEPCPTLMSSGQPSSCFLPLSLHWTSSRVSSLVGRCPFPSAGPSCSRVDPKLLGSVLLRGRLWPSLSARCRASGKTRDQSLVTRCVYLVCLPVTRCVYMVCLPGVSTCNQVCLSVTWCVYL